MPNVRYAKGAVKVANAHHTQLLDMRLAIKVTMNATRVRAVFLLNLKSLGRSKTFVFTRRQVITRDLPNAQARDVTDCIHAAAWKLCVG